MQVVAAVKGRQHAGRLAWITQRAVEVDDGIEFAAVADPVVGALAYRFLVGHVAAGPDGARKRRHRAAVNRQAADAGAGDQLPVRGDELPDAGRRIGRCPWRAGRADVADSEQHNHRAHAGRGQAIAQAALAIAGAVGRAGCRPRTHQTVGLLGQQVARGLKPQHQPLAVVAGGRRCAPGAHPAARDMAVGNLRLG